jgi:DNA repair protein RadC
VVLGAMGDDRPREKLDRLGVAALGDNELVAIVLAHGGRRRPALDLANDLLQRSDGLHGLARALHDELRAVRGIGPAKAAQLLAAIELGRRTLQRPRPPARAFLTPRAIAEYLLPRYGSRPVEQVGVALLDARRNLLKIVPLTVGTTDGSAIHPRDVFRAAIAANATAVIVFHNHPTGDPAPSADDVRVTRQLVLAGDVMGIDMLDHVILGDGRYYSFKEAGRHGG